ncbi:hypothetical protein LIER_26707 [Lithospermum erythrorhizon]|uniref:Uncharacterized protein n=1 Tax=Lithospermum erythrorhizon TaxID=34254 RepID=A0AAV3RDD6_LITER
MLHRSSTRADVFEKCLQFIVLFLQVDITTAPGITSGQVARCHMDFASSLISALAVGVFVAMVRDRLAFHLAFVYRSVFPYNGPFGRAIG